MRIVNFGQIIDLDGGQRIAHQITVELDTGWRQQIQTDEGTVQQLLDVVTNPGARAVEYHDPLPPAFPDDTDPATAVVFGESMEEPTVDTDLDDQAGWHGPEGIMGVVADEPFEAPPASPGGLGHRPSLRIETISEDETGRTAPQRVKTVGKDEMGYPVVQGREAPVPEIDEEDGDQI